MPWKHVWKPNPSNKKIPVLKELPPKYHVEYDFGNYKIARIPVKILIEMHDKGEDISSIPNYYYCMFCEGWVEGEPYEYTENTIGPLCGRDGLVSACIRCGREIGFSGRVS